MTKDIKIQFFDQLRSKFGPITKLEGSQSLFDISEGKARIYVRYSKLHEGDTTFFGLRADDLQKLQGFPSILCFLWDGQSNPLLIPFSEYEEVFQNTVHAKDGQYKVQVLLKKEGTQFYIAKAGKFNVERYFSWNELEKLIDAANIKQIPEFSHSQVQTIIGSIGTQKNSIFGCPLLIEIGLTGG